MNNIPKKIRDDRLWKRVFELVQQIYSLADNLVTQFPEEEWRTVSKLRNSANDSLFYVSQAVANVTPEAHKYDLSNARKSLFTMQSMYTFGAKQKFMDLDPELIVTIDSLLAEIDERIANNEKEVKKKNKEELEPWLEKYHLWQKMQD